MYTNIEKRRIVTKFSTNLFERGCCLRSKKNKILERVVIVLATLFFLIISLQTVVANSYIVDLNFITSKTVYTKGERLELKGTLYYSNLTVSEVMLTNHSALANAIVNFSIINKNTNETISTYGFNTTSSGEFYSRNDYYPSALLVSAPSTSGDYYIQANYTDPNNSTWWTRLEIQAINQTVDRILVSPEKVTYNPGETVSILVEAIRESGSSLVYIENVTINGTIRDSSKTTLSSFSCVTSSIGKCYVSATASSTYGFYFIEANNFKAFNGFEVRPFSVNINMKDNLGLSAKNIFNTAEQASIEVGVVTNSTTDTYSFDGVVVNSAGTVVKTITSTELTYNTTYINRFTFTLDALSFPAGQYYVDVNVTRVGNSNKVRATTAFEISSWGLSIKKKEIGSGFDYEYSAYPGKAVYLEIYPTWKGNGSVISNINATTSINISIKDSMDNSLSTSAATFNSSCSTNGCFEFSLTMPTNPGSYSLAVTVSNNGEIQTVTRKLGVVSTAIFAQSTDKDGSLKELFGTNEFVYLGLSGKNLTGSLNLTTVESITVSYMNGSEFNYTQVSTFDLVNGSNSNLEWTWNVSNQMIKLDAPSTGGFYTVLVTAENKTAFAYTRFIINPYDICVVAKNTPGQAGGSTGYYYVYQFKTSETIYFELKLTQANNPLGRASAGNGTNANSSYGKGYACSDLSSTKQVVNNATITIDEVTNIQTGRRFSLNTSESVCQSDDSKGGYSCTLKSIGNWDAGSYSVKFKIYNPITQVSDFAYANFEAHSFYLYAWATNWRNKPTNNVNLNVYMYEAGNNWWGNYGSGGLTGTVTVERIEYNGREGEWISPPITYDYNVSRLNTSTVTNGQGTISLPANYSLSGQWHTGNYRAVLKGVDNGGKTDYGYASFEIRRWEVYASPVSCSGSTCTSLYNLNSKSNVSLYVTITNAGEWGQNGNSLTGNVSIRVKKIQDCRRWPCSDLNTSLYNATNITVGTSSGWYYSGSINPSYIINITPTSGAWGTGYWQVVFDINGTETGTGWFNTIAFYAEAQPTDINGTSWKYTIKSNEQMYFKITTVSSQKTGSYYGSYGTTDYINTTIDGAVLRVWDQSNYKQIEYKYPTDFNISIVNASNNIINGTRTINVTYLNGSWPTGYYWGELTLRNQADDQTASAYLWFQVRPFRVQPNSNQYTIDNTGCVNGTIYVYEPDWNTNTVVNGSYNITSVTERTWSGSGSSTTTYTNFTPSGTFNGSSTFTVCPNNGRWSNTNGDGYHYITIKVVDSTGSSEEGWLSFRTLPFSVSWGSIIGGTNIRKTSNFSVPVTLTTPMSGANTTGNLTRIYQTRYDTYPSSVEEYIFSVGSCFSNVSSTCNITGTQTVTIYPPSTGWKDGYNYLQAEWTEAADSTSKVRDYNGVWFNGADAYTGWWNNIDENNNWKYNFGLGENISIKLYVNDISTNAGASVNILSVEYATPGSSCWDDNCRSYTTATYSVVGQSNSQISGSGTIRIVKPSANWTRGNIAIRATVNGTRGTSIIKNGNVYVKDLTAPVVTLSSPSTGLVVNTSSVWINWSTTETSTCYINVLNFANFNSWYCGSSYYNISTQSFCNTTVFNGTSYVYDWVSKDYRSWSYGNTWGYSSSSTGMTTGGTTHYYNYTTSALVNQSYGTVIYCYDEDWNTGYGWSAFKVNMSA